MSIFKRKEKRSKDPEGVRIDDPAATLARAFGLTMGTISFEQALQLPPVAASIDFISSICARVPIKLYRESISREGIIKTEEITCDKRVDLLNFSTGDSLNAFQMKKAWVRDYFDGAGYIFIDSPTGSARSLRYVSRVNVSVNKSTDPIFKDADFFVRDKKYFYWQFLRLCRNTEDGFTGRSIVDTNGQLISLMYDTMKFERLLMETGGNKKGFLKAGKKLTKEAMAEVRQAWEELYSQRVHNMMILNDNLDFKETSATSTELQLNENKLTNNDALTMIFLLSAKALQGAGDDDIVSAVKTAVIPIIEQMEQAFNDSLLLEEEKRDMYFSCDTSALERGDILKRFQAYKLAVEGNFMQPDEIRYKEDMPALGLNFIKLGLDSVLYDPKTKTVYTPNTNQTAKMGQAPQQEEPQQRFNENHDEKGRFASANSSGTSTPESSGKGVDKSPKVGYTERVEAAKNMTSYEKKIVSSHIMTDYSDPEPDGYRHYTQYADNHYVYYIHSHGVYVFKEKFPIEPTKKEDDDNDT